MAYRILFHTKIFIHYIIFDFIEQTALETIDCKTEDGQIRYINVFGFKKFIRLARLYNTDVLILKGHSNFVIRKNLIDVLFQNLNERSKRLVAAFLLISFNAREKVILSKLCKLDLKTIRKGVKELFRGSVLDRHQIRKAGGGRKTKIEKYPDLLALLEFLTEDHIAGDPMNGRRWVRKSLVHFKNQLVEYGIIISPTTVKKYFRRLKISLKVNKKSISTQQYENRDSQFKQITRIKKAFLKSGNPVISIDTKKKEQIGLFKNQGSTWKKTSISVYDHDFKNLGEETVVPFGIYDLRRNKGEIYCGNSHETSKFIVEMIVRWWEGVGQIQYVDKRNLLILCDAGGSNGYRRHGWKIELQNLLASRFDLQVTVCHYPPGTSKWNPIEHRVFSFISINWSGIPLDSIDTMLNLLNATTTKQGLVVRA